MTPPRPPLPVLILAAAVVGAVVPSLAEPHRPADDAAVLEVLPRVLFAAGDQLAEMRREVAADPDNPEVAARVAGVYLGIGKREGDPRFSGYAQAVLAPWWETDEAPPAILKLRSKIRERDHDYDGALADLELALGRDPGDAQAWVERANILYVQGRYAEAAAAADRLAELGDPISLAIARGPLRSATGHAVEELAALDPLEAAAREKNLDGVVNYCLLRRAEICEALGRDDEAERHYLRAIANAPDDGYLLRARADFLLDRDRPAEVFSLVTPHVADTGLLLRGAIAAKRSGDEELAAEWSRRLGERFAEIRLREGQPHGRYEARWLLELKDDPQAALAVALENWEQQKQPRDTRNLLEAALAAGDPAAAKPAIAFLKDAGTEDAVLRRLVERLETR